MNSTLRSLNYGYNGSCCKDCENRSIGCHKNCQNYKAYKKGLAKWKIKIRKAKRGK